MVAEMLEAADLSMPFHIGLAGENEDLDLSLRHRGRRKEKKAEAQKEDHNRKLFHQRNSSIQGEGFPAPDQASRQKTSIHALLPEVDHAPARHRLLLQLDLPG